MHDLSDLNKVLDIAIEIAKSDGAEVPDKKNLGNSFIGLNSKGHRFIYIIGAHGARIHTVELERIKQYMDTNADIKEGSSASTERSNADTEYLKWVYKKIQEKELTHIEAASHLVRSGFEHAHGGVDWAKWNEYIRNHLLERVLECSPTPGITHPKDMNYNSDPTLQGEQLYQINSDDFFVCDWLKKLETSKRAAAIEYILRLHYELDKKFITELSDENDNCLLDTLSVGEIERVAIFLSHKQIKSFYLDSQKLLFASKVGADAFSLKLRGIYSYLNIISEISGVDHLNLELLDPKECDKNEYTNEMEGLLSTYYSLFPRETGAVRR